MDEQVNLTAITSKKVSQCITENQYVDETEVFQRSGQEVMWTDFFIFQLLGMQVEISAVNKHALLSDMQVK